MTTPGGVPNLPQGALTIDNLASVLQDMTGAAMHQRATERFPSIMDTSTGLNPSLELTPFGLLTRIFAEVQSLIANADPADIEGPEDLPPLVQEWIEGLPFVGELVGLLEAILGTYDGDDTVLLQVQAIFDPIRKVLQMLSGISSGFPTLEQITSGNAEQFVTALLSPTGLLGLSAGQIAEDLFGITDGDLPFLGGNLQTMLGNPNLSTGFDPISAGQGMLTNVLTPAGALTTGTQVLPHMFGFLAPGSSTGANVQPDPGFDDPSHLAGQGIYTWDGSVDHTGTAGSGSAKTVANGSVRSLVGFPITTAPDQPATLGVFTQWSGVSAAAGAGIVLAAQAYDANNDLISDPTNRVVASIPAPETSSTSHSGNVAGWVYLQGGYQMPAGTKYVRLVVEVGANVNVGSVWFDDTLLQLSGLVDATLLTNFENMLEGVVPGNALQGFQGLATIFGSFGHLFDGMGSAMSLAPQNGLSFSGLFDIAQGSSLNANEALIQGLINTAVLGQRTNKRTAAGANPTTEAMIPLPHFGGAGALATTAVPAGTAILQVFRPGEIAKKGFIEFIAQNNGGVGGVFLNLFKWDGAQWVAVWNSTDLMSTLPTGSPGVVRALIPGGSQPTMNAGEHYLLGLANNTASALTVVTKNTAVPNNPNETISNFGGTRTLASSGGTSPSTLANTGVSYTGNVPYFGVGMLDVPAGYVPFVVNRFTSNGTWSKPGGFVTGDLVDVFMYGGAGGGQSGGYGLAGTGGDAGHKLVQTFVLGSDIRGTGYPVLPLATILSVVVGQGGGGGVNPYTFQVGNTGTASTVSGAGISTLTAAGGIGGGRGGQTNSGQGGQGAGDLTVGDYTMYGGAACGLNQNAVSPAGGGGSGYPAFGHPGADGEVRIRTRQGS